MAKMTTTPIRCPEANFRASLSDPEFWEYVLLGIKPGDHEPDWDGIGSFAPDEPEPGPNEVVMNPCEVCGEWGPCGYDAEGRILVHWQPPNEED